MQGDIWWAEGERLRRPVLVVTRSEAIPVLTKLVVAPVTRTVRGIPTEISLGPEQGLAEPCAASFDNLQTFPRKLLTRRMGRLSADQTHEICRAVTRMTDC
jgi:mRNA interferase MazF